MDQLAAILSYMSVDYNYVWLSYVNGVRIREIQATKGRLIKLA